MLTLIKKNKAYFFCFVVYAIIGAILLLSFQKGDLEYRFNQYHKPILDTVLKYTTFFGDGLFAFPLILVITLFSSKYKGLIFFISMMAQFIVIHALKWFVFENSPRPSVFFPQSLHMYYVEGVDIYSYNSFPSGHSSQAFCLFLLFALFATNKKLGPLFFLLAFSVGLSRIYLLQHFFVDTYFGAVISTGITFLSFYYFENHTDLKNNKKLQKPVFPTFEKFYGKEN